MDDALDLDLLLPTVGQPQETTPGPAAAPGNPKPPLELPSGYPVPPGTGILARLPAAALTRLLHQAGYLTFAPDSRLRVPNREIARRLGALLLQPYVASEMQAFRHMDDVTDALRRLHIPDLVSAFDRLLAQFPWQRFITPRGGDWENPYHLLFEVAALPLRPQAQSEKPTLQGTADHEIVLSDAILITEFKAGARSSANQGWVQIEHKAYLQARQGQSPCLIWPCICKIDKSRAGSVACMMERPWRGVVLSDESPWPQHFDLRHHGLADPA